ncbi:hypothetical protein [Laspinema olomoucense]|uniref:hypothetical protein n=1 Tax=Laspinema olomoucense TaxID=3231600 RepID=UPI0021BA9735|nr:MULTISPECIES: hypothetical protein [unclassified Laspinema]MCT7975519.1 hypothetical protein [Laspinema sp. D3d]MCT7994816.1 hypothetical protein [Laspinema sp. D3c]
MATLSYGFNPSFLPLSDRDQKALNSMFEGLEGDPLAELETVLNESFGARSQKSTRVRQTFPVHTSALR